MVHDKIKKIIFFIFVFSFLFSGIGFCTHFGDQKVIKVCIGKKYSEPDIYRSCLAKQSERLQWTHKWEVYSDQTVYCIMNVLNTKNH